MYYIMKYIMRGFSHNEANGFITCIMKRVMKLVMKPNFITVT